MPIKTSQYGGRGSVAREMERRRARKRKIEIREELGLSPNASDQEVLEVQRENARAEKELEERREKLRILTGGVALYQLQILLSVAKLNHPRLSPIYSEFLDHDVLVKIMHTVEGPVVPSEEELKSMTDTEINDLLNKYKLDTPRARIIERDNVFSLRTDLKNNYSDLYNKIKKIINKILASGIIIRVRQDLVDDHYNNELYKSMKLKTDFEDAHKSQLMAVGCVAPLEVNFDDPRFIIDLMDRFDLESGNIEGNIEDHIEDHILPYLVGAFRPLLETKIDILKENKIEQNRKRWRQEELEIEALIAEREREREREAREYALQNPWLARRPWWLGGDEMRQRFAREARERESEGSILKVVHDAITGENAGDYGIPETSLGGYGGIGGGLKQNRKVKLKKTKKNFKGNKSRKRSKTKKRKTKKHKSRRKTKRRS